MWKFYPFLEELLLLSHLEKGQLLHQIKLLFGFTWNKSEVGEDQRRKSWMVSNQTGLENTEKKKKSH